MTKEQLQELISTIYDGAQVLTLTVSLLVAVVLMVVGMIELIDYPFYYEWIIYFGGSITATINYLMVKNY